MTDPAEEFRATCSSPEANLLVIAPPGCGKTELLARRAEFLIKALRPGQKILALTFSNKAKDNLSSRLVRVLGAERKRRFITVHNFHGHAAEIVRSHGATLGIATDFEMPDKHTQSQMVKPLTEGLRDDDAAELTKKIDDALREAKQGAYDDATVLNRLRSNGLQEAIHVEEGRQLIGLLFYDDLLRFAQRLLEVEEVSNLYRNHYGAVLVDEFQDLSPQQLEIALHSCDLNRTFVGDPLQGIYSWTGARPKEVEKELRKICGEPLGLGRSYRSSPRVLDLLGAVSSSLGGTTLEAHDPSQWFEGGFTAAGALPSAVLEAQFVREFSSEILSIDPAATVGVICRSGWRRKEIDTEFATTETPCVRWDLAVDDPSIITRISDALDRLGGAPTIDALKAELISTIDPSDPDTASDVFDALDQLADIAEDGGSITSAITQLRVREESDEPIPPGVHLLNAHTGKGQQFDWVFIPGFEDGNVPSFLARGMQQEEEEHRVLLVMLSRARHGVVLTRANSRMSKKNKPYAPSRSPWADEVRPAVVGNLTELRAHLARMAEAQ